MEIEDPSVDFTQSFDVALPTKVKNNGSMFLAVVSTPKEIPTKKKKTDIFTNPEATFTMVPFTLHQVYIEFDYNLNEQFWNITFFRCPKRKHIICWEAMKMVLKRRGKRKVRLAREWRSLWPISIRQMDFFNNIWLKNVLLNNWDFFAISWK